MTSASIAEAALRNSLGADGSEVERGIALLFQPGDVVEVRIPKTRAGVVAGYFDDLTAIVSAISAVDRKYKPAGIYDVLNRIDHSVH